jgi:hypothetical protein
MQEILESNYDRASTANVTEQQLHLSQRQQQQLAEHLAPFTTLFSGNLGCYPHEKVHHELAPDAKPFQT